MTSQCLGKDARTILLHSDKLFCCSYTVERKDLSDTSADWLVIQRDLDRTSFKYKDYDVGRDYLYRVRASNEYGESDPSMVASYYAKAGWWTIFGQLYILAYCILKRTQMRAYQIFAALYII